MKIEDKILKIHKLLTESSNNDFRPEYVDFDEFDSKLYEQLSFIWDESKKIKKNTPHFDKNKLKKNIFSEIDKFENSQTKRGKLIFIQRYSSVAAVFLLLVFAISLFNNNIKINNTYKSKNTIELIELSDNSRIILDSKSKLRKSNDFNEINRFVFLDGNAYFNIKHNISKPFVIKVEDFEVKVLGTSFQIGHDPDDNIYVKVDEGTVNFKKSDGKSIILQKGESSVYNQVIGTFENYIPVEYENDLRSEYLHFENSNVTDVLAKLSEFYDLQFDVVCDQIKDYNGYTSPINSNFGIEDYIATLEKLYTINFVKIDNKVFTVKCK